MALEEEVVKFKRFGVKNLLVEGEELVFLAVLKKPDSRKNKIAGVKVGDFGSREDFKLSGREFLVLPEEDVGVVG